ncbi:MAG: acyl-CoA/acyl-ACP dehydrogenase [Deltaproteobacteria bacterium]|nr:acyl-CoA/acyl-ACP dehydrogenase [Deltaproteobacteria bacterium]MDQ3300246.1 acyl-CoA/acyl-ACP dehydrogenase [Myxococcota bacterium]
MDFALDDEQNMIVQTVKRFSDRDLRGWTADADRTGVAPDRLTAAAKDLGFFVDGVPADADGLLDGSYSHTNRALRGFELGRGCAGLAALLETNVEPALAVGKWGSTAVKQAMFGALASGGLAVLAHDSRGTLEIGEAGGELRVTGKLGPLPALAVASHAVVIAKDVLFVVALDARSTVRREAMTPSGWRAAKWGTAQLDGHRIAPDHVLARGVAAAAASAEVLAWARVSLAARAVGVATAAMDHAEQYGIERVQFGQQIGTFESLIRLLDDARTTAFAARVFTLQAASAIDRDLATAGDLASRARVLAGDAVTRATIDAVQMYGGYGFVNDYPVEKLMRDARAFEVLHGDERLGRVLAYKASRVAGKD